MDWFNQADDLCAAVRVACRIGQALHHEFRQWSGINLKEKGVEMLVPCSVLPGEDDARSIKRARQVMDLLGGAWTHTNDTDGRRSFVQSFEGVRVKVYGVAHECMCTCCDPQEKGVPIKDLPLHPTTKILMGYGGVKAVKTDGGIAITGGEKPQGEAATCPE